MRNCMALFEADAVEMLLAGEDDVLRALRRQSTVAKRKTRKFTGVGFFTYYVIPPEFILHGKPSFVISDVWETIPGLESPVGLSLFMRAGVIDMLEGAACAEDWSAVIDEYSLFYQDGPVRDLAKLRATPGWPETQK